MSKEFINWFRKLHGEDKEVVKGNVSRDVWTEFHFIPEINPTYVLVNKSIGWDEYANCESYYVLYVVARREAIAYCKMFQDERSRGWLGESMEYKIPSVVRLESHLVHGLEYEEAKPNSDKEEMTYKPLWLKNVEMENILLRHLKDLISPLELRLLVCSFVFQEDVNVKSKQIENFELPKW